MYEYLHVRVRVEVLDLFAIYLPYYIQLLYANGIYLVAVQIYCSIFLFCFKYSYFWQTYNVFS